MCGGTGCSLLGPKPSEKSTAGCIFTRSFKSGTKVYVGQYQPPDHPTRPNNRGSCVFWADGTVTSPNEANCPAKGAF